MALGMLEGARTASRRAVAQRRVGTVALFMGALALALQLVLAFAHMAGDSRALSALGALTGGHGVLCADSTHHDPRGPTQGDLDCSGLCCQLGHSLAALPALAYLPLTIILAGLAELLPLPVSPAPPEPRGTLAQPRGPPATS